MKNGREIKERAEKLEAAIVKMKCDLADSVLAGQNVDSLRQDLLLVIHEQKVLNWVMTPGEQLS